MYISSSNNDFFKMLKSFKQKKYRQRTQQILVEGERTIRQLMDLGIAIDYIILNESCEFDDFIGKKVYLAETLFKKLSDTVNSQGIMALISLQSIKPVARTDKPLIVLDRLQDAGNVGTILRTAKALGYSDVIMLKGTVDLYNPKVLRASMGAAFALNIRQEVEVTEFISDCQKQNKSIVATSLTDAKDLSERRIYSDCALVFGNEANGICAEILAAASEKLYIPLTEFESLNVAISAGIFLYEFAK